MIAPWWYRKATCDPCGAAGLPEVNADPLADTPDEPTKAHGEAPGAGVPNVPEAYVTCSKPGSPTVGSQFDGPAAGASEWIETPSRKTVASVPTESSPWNVIVCVPAATKKARVWKSS